MSEFKISQYDDTEITFRSNDSFMEIYFFIGGVENETLDLSFVQAKSLVQFLNDKINKEESKFHLPVGAVVQPVDLDKYPFLSGIIVVADNVRHLAEVYFHHKEDRHDARLNIPFRDLKIKTPQ